MQQSSKSFLDIESFVFDPLSVDPNGSALKLTGKRYSQRYSSSEDGFILFFAHGAAFHKEQWEPVIEKIFLTLNSETDRTRHVHEAWALDWQNHGAGGLVNEKALETRDRGVSMVEWGRGIAAFIKSRGFPPKRTIAIGHSAGCSAIILAAARFGVDNPPYAAMILVETSIFSEEVDKKYRHQREAHFPKVTAAIKASRSTWESRESALEWIKQRAPFSRWDPRVQKLYVEHALYQKDPNTVAVKCNKIQEAGTMDNIGSQYEAAAWFGRFGKAGTLPVHCIHATKFDFSPRWIQDNLFDEKEGRIAASVTKVQGVGHYIPQEKPDECALIISMILRGIAPAVGSSAKL